MNDRIKELAEQAGLYENMILAKCCVIISE
jgi:hypothetical protein